MSTVSREQPLIIEIPNDMVVREVATGELAAIVHLTNIQEIHPRSVFIYRNDSFGSKKVSILSPQYEPLQYLLLFSHGTPGWSPSAMFASNKISQIQWYKMRLLTEPRFQTFGRLANEYLIDMFSRVEEERLQYIRSSHSFQLKQLEEQREEAFILDPDLKL